MSKAPRIILPSYDNIMEIHEVVLRISGGRSGTLNPSVIDSAIHRPLNFQSYYTDGFDIHIVSAAIIDTLARDHAFIEGNKRTALLTMLMTYYLNGVKFTVSDAMNNDYENTVLWIVLDKPSVVNIAKRLKELAHKYGDDI